MPRSRNTFETFFWLVLMPSIIVIVWAQLAGICVYQFKTETCDVSSSVATFTTNYRGWGTVVTMKDPRLTNLTTVTCYIATGLVGPAIELDTTGIVFHTCGIFSIFSIVMYFFILIIYAFCILPDLS